MYDTVSLQLKDWKLIAVLKSLKYNHKLIDNSEYSQDDDWNKFNIHR